LHRTEQLSRGGIPSIRDSDGFVRSPQGRPPFIRLVPLLEIVADTLGQGVGTQRVQSEYRRILGELGGELTVLTQATIADLEAVAGERLAQGILKARIGDIQVEPGYDGVFGKICLWPGDRNQSLPP
jgi:PHP family Zn ribbon phosphoesterase